MNRFNAKTIISLFLSVILVTGTIAISSSFMINAQAQPSYYYDYRMNDNNNNYYESSEYPSSYRPDYYKPEYQLLFGGKDNNYKSTKDSTSLNKIKCINDNININGVNTGDVNIGNKGQVPAPTIPEGYLGAYSYDSGYGEGYDNKKNKTFDCVINNDNENRQITPITPSLPPSPPSPPIDTTETLTVIKNVDCQADPATCEQTPIEPQDFAIVIEEGNNPSQTRFPGSFTGTDVELEPGPYRVSEAGLDPTTPAICTNLGYDAGRDTKLGIICINFSDGCDGDITVGIPQTCIIDNVLVETPTEILTVIKNVDCQADTETCERNPIQLPILPSW